MEPSRASNLLWEKTRNGKASLRKTSSRKDLSPSGVCGDPTLADAAHGRALVEQAAAKLVEILAEIDRFPLDRLRPPPST